MESTHPHTSNPPPAVVNSAWIEDGNISSASNATANTSGTSSSSSTQQPAVSLPRRGGSRAPGRPRARAPVVPRQISLQDFSESESEEEEVPAPPDDEAMGALDAWGLTPGDFNRPEPDQWDSLAAVRSARRPARHLPGAAEWFTPPSVVVLGRDNSRTASAPPPSILSKKGGPPRMPTLAVQCPLCLEPAVDTTSTPCGHVGCGPVSACVIYVEVERLLMRHLGSAFTRACN